MSYDSPMIVGKFIFLIFVLGYITLSDMKTRTIPDGPVCLLIVTGVILPGEVTSAGVVERALSATGAFLAFWAIGEVYYQRCGVDGLGIGDAKLLAGIAAWIGWRDLPLVVLTASLAGIALILLGAERIAGRPFAPRELSFPLDRKPVLPGGPEFSVSHSDGHVACCIVRDADK